MYSDWSFGTAGCGAAAVMAVAASWAPLDEYSLKFLSLSVPMAVTIPIFALVQSVGGVCAAPALAPAHGSGATLAAGLPPVLVHADSTRAAPATRVSPNDRICTFTPPDADPGGPAAGGRDGSL